MHASVSRMNNPSRAGNVRTGGDESLTWLVTMQRFVELPNQVIQIALMSSR